MQILRGNVYYANLGIGVGHEQEGTRPVLILQNDIGNLFSSTVIVAPLTRRIRELATRVFVESSKSGLRHDSDIELEQVRTISIERLDYRSIGRLSPEIMQKVDEILQLSLGIKANDKEAKSVEKENSLITIQGVRGFVDSNGTVHLHQEDVARGLGFVERKGESEYIRWGRLNQYMAEYGFATSGENEYVPENIFYLLAMKANNETAIAFQMKVANEILPSIRKTGGYYSGLSKELQAIFITDKKVQVIETRLDTLDKKVDNQITVTYIQAKTIQFAVASRVIELLGGKSTLDYKSLKGSYFQQLHHDLKDRLGVPSYRDIRKLDYDAALAYIKAWLPKASDKSV